MSNTHFYTIECECGCIYNSTDPGYSHWNTSGKTIYGCLKHKAVKIKRFLHCACGNIEEISISHNPLINCSFCVQKAKDFIANPVTKEMKSNITKKRIYHFDCGCITNKKFLIHNKITCHKHRSANLSFISSFCVKCNTSIQIQASQTRKFYCNDCAKYAELAKNICQKNRKRKKRLIPYELILEEQAERYPDCIHYNYCLFTRNIFEINNAACLNCAKFEHRLGKLGDKAA